MAHGATINKACQSIKCDKQAIQIPTYFLLPQRITRGDHLPHYKLPRINTVAYQHSFCPRTVKERNRLPSTFTETRLQVAFKPRAQLSEYLN